MLNSRIWSFYHFGGTNQCVSYFLDAGIGTSLLIHFWGSLKFAYRVCFEPSMMGIYDLGGLERVGFSADAVIPVTWKKGRSQGPKGPKIYGPAGWNATRLPKPIIGGKQIDLVSSRFRLKPIMRGPIWGFPSHSTAGITQSSLWQLWPLQFATDVMCASISAIDYLFDDKVKFNAMSSTTICDEAKKIRSLEINNLIILIINNNDNKNNKRLIH